MSEHVVLTIVNMLQREVDEVEHNINSVHPTDNESFSAKEGSLHFQKKKQ